MSDAQREEAQRDAWMIEQILKAEAAEEESEDWRLYECSVTAD